MGFFKSLKNQIRSQVQNPNAPTVNPSSSGSFLKRASQRFKPLPQIMPDDMRFKSAVMPDDLTFTDPRDMPRFDIGSLAPDRYMPDERAFIPDTSVNRESKYIRGPSRLPQRMPQQGPSNRFFGGGLGSIFNQLPQRAPERRMPPNNRRNFMQRVAGNFGAPLSNSMEEQRPMAPMLPMPQEMPERNLLGRLPFQRPGFAEGGASDTTNESINTFLRKYTITPHLMDQRFFQEPSFDKWVNAARNQNKAGNPIPYVAPFMSDSIDALKVGYDSFLKEFKEKRSQNTNGRPGFAEGEDVNTNMLIAEQGAREGISPPEMAAQRMREFLGETGRTVSNRDIELFSVGLLTFEDIIDKATNSNIREILGESGRTISNMDRNLMQQEQMFFPDSGRTISDVDRNSLDDMLQDLEKKN